MTVMHDAQRIDFFSGQREGHGPMAPLYTPLDIFVYCSHATCRVDDRRVKYYTALKLNSKNNTWKCSYKLVIEQNHIKSFNTRR